MRQHLHLLGLLQLAWGAIGLLLGVAILLLAIGAVAIGVSMPDQRMYAGGAAGILVVVSGVLLVFGLLNAWAARAVRRNEARGRMAVLWLAVPNLFVLPFGTALGIYAFWVLLNNEIRAVFLGVRT
jgi:hypothetical protein